MTTPSPAKATPSRADQIAITVVLVIGMSLGGWITGLGIVNGIFRLVDPGYLPITLFGTIPVSASGGVTEAHGDRLVVMADNIPGPAAVLFGVADILIALTIGVVTAAVCQVIFRVLEGRPFQRGTRIAALVVGAALAIGSLLSQGALGFAQMITGDALSADLGGVSTAGFEFNAVLPAAGLAILALSYVFRAGERLQRDTEGLV